MAIGLEKASGMLRKTLIPYLLLAAALIGGLLWHQSQRVPGLGRVVSSGQADVGGPFRLTDQNGKTVTDTDFRGRYMLIFFGYSFCPDICPTTMGVAAQALETLGGRANRVVPIFITTDPERDTPQVLGEYMKAFGPNFIGLTGSPAAIQEVGKKFRVYAVKKPLDPAKGLAGGYSVDHSSVLYLMGPDGKLVSFYDGPVSPDDLAKDLQKKL
ncbi:MAG TPA: SCO family protein [Rhizomicrobium sp.]|nr:SCO family protein [Rhizomicrobium sp.]